MNLRNRNKGLVLCLRYETEPLLQILSAFAKGKPRYQLFKYFNHLASENISNYILNKKQNSAEISEIRRRERRLNKRRLIAKAYKQKILKAQGIERRIQPLRTCNIHKPSRYLYKPPSDRDPFEPIKLPRLGRKKISTNIEDFGLNPLLGVAIPLLMNKFIIDHIR